MRRRMMHSKILIEVIEELKNSGTWTVPLGCYKVDVFLVGGGAGGAYNAGGGGYTKTVLNEIVRPGQLINYVIGQGGQYGGMNGSSGGGGITYFGTLQVDGGAIVKDDLTKGGDGGSGGAGYTHATGGSDGNSGSHGEAGSNPTSCPGGMGQGTSTRCPFTNKLYSTGGSTGRKILNPTGNWGDSDNTLYRHGAANTGEGGSGSGWYGGNGGSGIIILRYKKFK